MQDEALHQLTYPWLIALSLVLTSYWLEDVAIAAAVASATQGHLSWAAAYGAVVLGIASGDILLYALGSSARRMKWLRRRLLNPRQSEQWRERLDADLLSAVLLARVIPGLRFVTYSACGFVQVALPAFCVGVLLAVITWTAGLFALSALSGQALADTLGVSPTWAALVPVAVLALSSMIWRRTQSKWHE
jgi:membrane protein DedA with SNARE-associated domain